LLDVGLPKKARKDNGVRLFVAINFGFQTIQKLAALGQELQTQSSLGRFTAPQNLHLTLAFLGEFSEDKRKKAKAIIEALRFCPFELAFVQVARFEQQRRRSKPGRPERVYREIWWAGPAEEPALLKLQADLTDTLLAAGLELEYRPFRPHVTLGRRVATDLLPWMIEPFGQTVEKIDLMLSEQVAGETRYTVL